MAISTGNQPDLEPLVGMEGKPRLKGMVNCGPAWVYSFECEAGVISPIWKLAAGLSESFRGQPLATTLKSPGEFVCRRTCWKQSWDTCRLTTWEMVKINSIVPSSEGGRGTMRKSNQQSLNSVKSVTKGNVEGVSLELGIQKIAGCIWARKGYWRSSHLVFSNSNYTWEVGKPFLSKAQ